MRLQGGIRLQRIPARLFDIDDLGMQKGHMPFKTIALLAFCLMKTGSLLLPDGDELITARVQPDNSQQTVSNDRNSEGLARTHITTVSAHRIPMTSTGRTENFAAIRLFCPR